MMNHLKMKFKLFLCNLASENKKTYGKGGINCCDLKKVTEPPKKSKQ